MDLVIRRCPCFSTETDDVHVLDYRHCSLNEVPVEVFTYERTLEELYLDSNQIRDLPRALFHCHGLSKLGLSDNEITSLPPAIASLISLEELDIGKNGILDIPDNIKGCKCLRVVDASINPLGKLPSGFTLLISLEELYLNDTFLDFLPANFGRLSKLKILELRENHLKTLPKSMARLVELSRLDIGQNNFNELPDVVGSLPKLNELWCDCNQISALPLFLGNLKQLTYLDASRNLIESMPVEIGHCRSLTDLTLSGNCLQRLPESIGELKKLRILRLDDNQLCHLPTSIGCLSNLEELVLNQNDLESLPLSIGLLRKLHMLNLDDNFLEELPPELGSCIALTIFSARGNRLTRIPDELGHVPNLHVINISDNRIRNLPFSITKLRCLQALWLSENQTKPLIPLQSDIDIDTGQRVLTCFILPQMSGKSTAVDASVDDVENQAGASSQPERRRRTIIKFAFDEELEKPGKLVRAPTPYPKELKAHAKHAKNLVLKYKEVSVDAAIRKSEMVAAANAMAVQAKMAESTSQGNLPTVLLDASKVKIKEAKVTKPKSPHVPPKLHDAHLLYKCDKEKQAKDKARLQRHISQSHPESRLVSDAIPKSYELASDKGFSPNRSLKSDGHVQKLSGSPNLLHIRPSLPPDSQVVFRQSSSMPELAAPLDPQFPARASFVVREAKFCKNVSNAARKLENLHGGTSQGDREFGHQSDHEIYANVGHRKSKRLRERGVDGYRSDGEASRAASLAEDDYAAADPSSSPLRLWNDTCSESLSFMSEILLKQQEESRLLHRQDSSPTSNNGRAGSFRMSADVACRNGEPGRTSRRKMCNLRGNDMPGVWPRSEETGHFPLKNLKVHTSSREVLSESQSTTHSVSPLPSPVPSLPPRQRPSTSNPSPPLSVQSSRAISSQLSSPSGLPLPLPPRQRPSLSPTTSLRNLGRQDSPAPALPPRERVPPPPLPPSPNMGYLYQQHISHKIPPPIAGHVRKPPPYHVAAALSKHSIDLPVGVQSPIRPASRQPPPACSHWSQSTANTARSSEPHNFPRSPRIGSRGSSTASSSPGTSGIPTVGAVPSPKLSGSQKIHQRRHTDPSPDGLSQKEDYELRTPLQRQLDASQGALVFENPYASQSGRASTKSSHDASVARISSLHRVPSLEESLPNRSSARGHGFGKPAHNGDIDYQISVYASPSCSRRRLPSALHQSASAPSTPPASEQQQQPCFHLPPYRSPPVYTSSNNSMCSAPFGSAYQSWPKSNSELSAPHCTSSFSRVQLPTDAAASRATAFVGMSPQQQHSLGETDVFIPTLPPSAYGSWSNNQTSPSQNGEMPSAVLECKPVPLIRPSWMIHDAIRSTTNSGCPDLSMQSGIFTARPAIIENTAVSNIATCVGGGRLNTSSGLTTHVPQEMSNNMVTRLDAVVYNSSFPPKAGDLNSFSPESPRERPAPFPFQMNTCNGELQTDDSLPLSSRATPPQSPLNHHSSPASQTVNKNLNWLFGQHKNPHVMPVVVQKNPDLGFGVTQSSSGKGIYVSSVTPEGPSSTVLRPGDKILQVDGMDFTRIGLERALQLLEASGSSVFMMISRE